MISLPGQNASSILHLLFIMHLRTVPGSVGPRKDQTNQGRDELLGEGGSRLSDSNMPQCGEVPLNVTGATKLQSSPHTRSVIINTTMATNC